MLRRKEDIVWLVNTCVSLKLGIEVFMTAAGIYDAFLADNPVRDFILFRSACLLLSSKYNNGNAITSKDIGKIDQNKLLDCECMIVSKVSLLFKTPLDYLDEMCLVRMLRYKTACEIIIIGMIECNHFDNYTLALSAWHIACCVPLDNPCTRCLRMIMPKECFCVVKKPRRASR